MTARNCWPVSGALVAALACGESTAPPAPASVASDGLIAVGTAGLLLTTSPTIIVKDASGKTLGGVPLSVQVTAGGGTLTGAPSRTSSGSPTAVGNWTLGKAAGPNTVTVTAGSLPPLVITIIGLPGPAASATAASGNTQTSPAGTPLPAPLLVKVSDQFGNGVPNVSVTFTITAGGGALSATAATTDSSGIASGPTWTLGRSAAAQTVTSVAASAFTAIFTAVVASDYHAIVRFFGQAPPAEAEAAFTSAADRIRGLVTGDLPDISVTSPSLATTCGNSYPAVALNEVIDDLVVYATIGSIDGPGNVLASAGPCIVRTGSRGSVLGLMRFDADDVPNLIARGQLAEVILHEMLHVVGVGSLWRATNLISGRGTTDPRFTGSFGISACVNLGGGDACPGTIPIENTGGSGTADVHWRESVFDGELMTGFAESQGKTMPLSIITVQSLADMSYTVNVFSSDSYLVPLPSSSSILRSLQVGAAGTAMDVVLQPTMEVSRTGRLTPLPIQ